MSDPVAPIPLSELAKQARVPRALTDRGRKERFGNTRDLRIAPGQVWRAAWHDVSLLVLITRQAHEPDVGVIPVTLEPNLADDRSLIIAPSLTTFGVDATLLMDLESAVPLRVLDEIIDEWTADVTDALSPAELVETELPLGIRRGNPVETEFDRSLSMRAEIEDDLEALHSSPALPVETGGRHPARTLASVLGKNANLKALMSALEPLGLNQPEVMKLLRGKRPMTPEVVDAIVAATGVDRKLVAQTVQPLPVELVVEVDHPKWRTAWEQQAQQEQVDEFAVRLQAGYEVFSLAARQTGVQHPDWAARIVQYRAARKKGKS